MTSGELRERYLQFFQKQGHHIVPSAPLVPENDPTTLFTSSGMQPMLPFLLGETHPLGTRITDSQISFRSQDIEEVGDNRHDTLFEMLGNWSLGDYWKEDQLRWLFQFLTDELMLDPNRLYVTVFSGESTYNIPKDTESANIWKELFASKGINAQEIELGTEENGAKTGMQGGRIFYYGAKKNWWSRAGTPQQMPSGEPGGPDSEVFYEFTNIEHDQRFGEQCHPNCDCGRFLEIGNSVFMQYLKQENGDFAQLPQKNVDFGGGLERLLMAANNQPDMFKNDLHWSIIEKLTQQLGVAYEESEKTKAAMRVIADHIKAATFLIKNGVLPSNKLQGYVLRRLLRRAAVKINSIKEGSMPILAKLVDPVLDTYQGTGYFQIGDWDPIRTVVADEIQKFQKTLQQGLREIKKIETIDAKRAFDLYQTYGFPIELTAEIFQEKGQNINIEEFQHEVAKHQDLSRSTSAGIFKGGLQDHSEQTTKLHTATHLLNQSLRNVLGTHVMQRGSHITSERLRFDFPHPQKLTEEEIKKVENMVNEQIQKDLPVSFSVMDVKEAFQQGAIGAFGEKYPEKVKVYSIGNFSKEICGGPHIEHTGILGTFHIQKEEGVSAGVRRIYATIS